MQGKLLMLTYNVFYIILSGV